MIFKVLNPMTGTYIDASTAEECVAKMSEIALALYFEHVHHQPYSIVEKLENGAEVWRNPAGVELVNQDVLLQLMVQGAINSQYAPPPTNIEVLP
jgi:hypothetical protein